MARTIPSFSKCSENEDHEFESKPSLSPFLNNFAKSQNKQTAVEAARSRNAQSITQQLTAIMTGKSRYATVADAVQDMTERTGLGTYLETVKSAEESKKKVNKQANSDSQLPESLNQYDFAEDLVSYIHNNIKNSNGLASSVPQLQHDILDLFGKRGLSSADVMNDEFEKYLSDCIYEAQRNLGPAHHNSNIGSGVGKDIEDTNDAWAGLSPAK